MRVEAAEVEMEECMEVAEEMEQIRTKEEEAQVCERRPVCFGT